MKKKLDDLRAILALVGLGLSVYSLILDISDKKKASCSKYSSIDSMGEYVE